MQIKKINESYVKITDISSYEQEFIDKTFAVHEDNYIFNNAYKSGFWDGKKHFFDLRYNTLPIGFVPKLIDEVKRKFNSEIKIDFCNKDLDIDFKDFYSNLNLKEEIEIRDYQQLGFESGIKKGKCILKAATGAGKSLILWLLTKYLTENMNKDVLIIVPQTQLVEQLSEDFELYGPFKDGIEVGKSTTKKLGKREAKKLNLDWQTLSDEKALSIDLSKKIVISTWQTLQHKEKAFFDRFEAILMDEVHHIDGATIQEIINHCVNAKHKIGMSGTLKPSKKSQMIYEGFFQEQLLLITPRQLIDRGYATDVIIYPIVLHYPRKKGYKDLLEESNYLSYNEERVDFIVSLIENLYKKNENNNTLVLFKSVEKGFWLDIQERLQGKVENLFVVHGKVKLSDRLEAIKVSETKNNCIILASFSTFSTGINLKNLHNVIFTESYKSLVKIGQSIGRGMRKHSSKDKVNIFDITDKFENKNMTYKQYLERVKIYQELEYKMRDELNYTIKKI